ncbi:MAG: hypothetical protein H6705_19865 [Myxococcales bacterium]|nr:hypothetical protein [Myxococcales bacterium]
MTRPGLVLPLIALLASAAFPAGAAPKPKRPRLSPAAVPADGEHAATLTVSTFGRYAVRARSAQGTAIRLVDRMEGPGAWQGVTGERDGRLDVFLERGDYRIAVAAPEKGQGEVKLEVVASREQHKEPLRLVPERAVEATLADFEQRSWWLDIDADQVVALEAVGRHLADLRLWRDGAWLVDAAPSCGVIAPVTGRPHTRCQLVHRLPKGLYRLSAYGGPGEPWAEDSPERAFFLRWGVPKMGGDGGRMQRRIGAYGFDRFRLDGAAREVMLSLPTIPAGDVTVTLSVEDSSQRPFGGGGSTERIDKQSRIPVIRLKRPLVTENTVVVTGPPGQPYTIEWFPPAGTRTVLGGQGDYYLTTLYAGAPADRPDATGMLLRGDGPAKVIEHRQAVPLRSDRRYDRRFNLDGLVTVYLDVQQTGDFAIAAKGAELRVEPVLDEYPPGYSTPAWARDALTTALPTGLHLLTLRPADQGGVAIVELGIRPQAWNPLASGLDLPKSVTLPPVIQRGRVTLDHQRALTLVRNSQGEAPVGVVLRALPVALAEAPVPFTLGPGETVTIEAKSPGDGRVRAETAAGKALPVSVDGGDFGDKATVDDDTFAVTIKNTGDTIESGALLLELATPPPAATPLPDERLEALPAFPLLTAAEPARADLERNAEKTWTLRVEKPALYTLESTGLLATGGVLRTRTRVDFAREQTNGVGRNFRVSRYLGAGDYQLTVSTKGASAGRLGVRLETTALIDGGALRVDVPARRTVPAGRAVAYDFEITEAGRYRLRSVGRGHTFECRIEDAAGWPVTDPVLRCDETRLYTPGRYRVIVLPTAVETQRLTRLVRVRDAERFTGHGPHPLPARTVVQHVWREPVDGGERVPDWWDFTLPADSPVTIALSDEVHGELLRRGGGAVGQVERIAGGRDTALELTAGDYRLVVRGARRNDHVPYSVTLTPARLMAGQRVEFYPPEKIEVAVGAAGLYELTSDGATDLRGRLIDASGAVVAFDDDRPDGWNFRIAERLAPGRYTLVVDAPGDTDGRSTVTMEAPTAVEGAPLALGEARELVPDGASHYLPLPLAKAPPVLVARASSTQNVGLAIEAAAPGSWRTLASETGTAVTVAARPAAGVALRLRVWSLDQRGLPVTVTARAPIRCARPPPRSRSASTPATAPSRPSRRRRLRARRPDDTRVCLADGGGCARAPRPVAVDAGLVIVAEAGAGAPPRSRRRAGRARRAARRAVRIDLAGGSGAAVGRGAQPDQPPRRAPRRRGAHGRRTERRRRLRPRRAAAQATVTAGDDAPLDVRVRAVRISRPSEHKASAAPRVELAPRCRPLRHGRRPQPPGHARRRPRRDRRWRGLLGRRRPARRRAAACPRGADRQPRRRPGRAASSRCPAARPRSGSLRPSSLAPVRAGLRRVAVEAAPGATLRVQGALAAATFVTADSRPARPTARTPGQRRLVAAPRARPGARVARHARRPGPLDDRRGRAPRGRRRGAAPARRPRRRLHRRPRRRDAAARPPRRAPHRAGAPRRRRRADRDQPPRRRARRLAARRQGRGAAARGRRRAALGPRRADPLGAGRDRRRARPRGAARAGRGAALRLHRRPRGPDRDRGARGGRSGRGDAARRDRRGDRRGPGADADARARRARARAAPRCRRPPGRRPPRARRRRAARRRPARRGRAPLPRARRRPAAGGVNAMMPSMPLMPLMPFMPPIPSIPSIPSEAPVASPPRRLDP